MRRLSETTSARRWDISQNNLVTQEKVIFCFILLGINSTLFEQIETFSILVYTTSIPAWPLFNFCILKINNEGNYLWGDSIYLYSILHLCLCFGTEESTVFFFIIISAPPEMKAGLSKQRKFVKIQKNYFFVPQWLFRSLRVLLWIWISVFLKKRPFEYLPWYTRKRTIFGAALKGENLSCCCYINVGGFKCIYI